MRLNDASKGKKDSGQIGIELLIALIAIILVVVLAAGVFINTADLAQENAEQTADESLEEVSNQIFVVSESGVVNSTSIDTVFMTVRLSSGADEVDLGEATVEVLSNGTQEQLLYSGSVGSAGDSFGGTVGDEFDVNTIKDEDSSLPVLEDRGDRAELRFGLTSDQTLSGGDQATVTIVTQSGSENIAVLQAPQNLELSDGTVVRV